jgi:hypothetical protein
MIHCRYLLINSLSKISEFGPIKCILEQFRRQTHCLKLLKKSAAGYTRASFRSTFPKIAAYVRRIVRGIALHANYDTRKRVTRHTCGFKMTFLGERAGKPACRIHAATVAAARAFRLVPEHFVPAQGTGTEVHALRKSLLR